MARIYSGQASSRRLGLPVIAAIGVLLALVVVGGFLLLSGGLSGSAKPTSPTVTFTTEAGDNATEGAVDTPLTVNARIPRANGDPETLLVSASVQLLDASGKPAQYGGKALDAVPLKAGSTVGTWIAGGSVPSQPGAYHPVLQWQVLPDSPGATQSVTHTLELKDVVLQAKASSGAPLTSGFVFARDANLWIMSSDLTRQRRLTFFPSYYEYADNAAWSPDGKTIAFAYSPKVPANEIPATHIYTMNPDGTGMKAVAEHGQDESLYEPTWSPDGKSLFFTVEKSAMSSSLYDASGAPMGERRIDRLDLTTGQRTPWVDSSQSPDCCGAGDREVYLENVTSQDPSSDVPPSQTLVLTDLAGKSKTVLVKEKTYQMIYAPAVSPDGKWVVFAAINVPPPPQGSRFDFLKVLGLVPETAYAHGLPWDMYLVSTAGGTPIQLTKLSEDQPQPAWTDNSTILFMGVRGLYKVQIGADGQPKADAAVVHAGAPHGGLTFHAP